jgi:sterol 3beta-glucosyltransferase
MRIAIIATGSRGDVEPYLALGKGLAKAGHYVRLITHENFAALVNAHGVEFWPIEGNVQDVAQGMAGLIEGGNFFAIMAKMAKEAERAALKLAKGGLAACQSMELILAGLGGVFVGAALAEKLHIPLLQAYYIPFTPTRAFPSFIAPWLPAWSGGIPNRLSHLLARQVMWQSFRAADGLARKEVLGLPSAPLFGPFSAKNLRDYPVLYGYSPSVIPPPPDWDARICVTGYWFLEPPEDWSPPMALVDFLEAGPPPVYVGFGSMSHRQPGETMDLILAALARAGQRGIVLAGWGGLQKSDLPRSVMMVDSVPFAWLFPRVAAVVHHGGAGTTAAGLRAGIPSIVVPFFGDQPYGGQRVASLGVGPAPIPRKKLTADRLAQAIEKVVSDRAIRQRAADLGALIRTDDGVARAVAVVQDIAQRRAS